MADGLERLADRWGWVLALGALLIIAGALALGSTVVATMATVVFLGALLFVGGLIDVVTSFAARGWRGFGLAMVTGLLAATVGFMFMTRPVVAAGVLTLLLAIMLLVNGVARIVYSVAERFPSWGWTLASGIAAVVLGVLVFIEFPTSAFWFLGLAVAVELLMRGAMWTALAFTLRQAKSARDERGERRERTGIGAEPQPSPA